MIVDADAHVIESERTWDYLEAHEKKFRPSALTGSGGEKMWLVDGRLFSREAGNLELSPEVRQLEDLDTRAAIMDETQISVQVLYPTLFLQGLPSDRPEIQVALCRSYNRWLADVWNSNNRFRWAVVPPLLDMEASLAEIEIGHRQGACAVFMRGIERNWLLNDAYFEPLFEKADALNMPIGIHAGNGNDAFKRVLFSKDLYFFGITPILAAFNALATSAIAGKYKNLRFGFIEAGSQWVPYLVHEAARRHKFIKTKGKVESMGTFLEDNRFYVTARTDEDLPYVLRYTGPNRLMLGTDFGHEDPSSELDAFDKMRKDPSIGEGIIDGILSRNAIEFYNLSAAVKTTGH